MPASRACLRAMQLGNHTNGVRGFEHGIARDEDVRTRRFEVGGILGIDPAIDFNLGRASRFVEHAAQLAHFLVGLWG